MNIRQRIEDKSNDDTKQQSPHKKPGVMLPQLSRQDGTDTRLLGVVTDDGLFPVSIGNSQEASSVQEKAYDEPQNVTVFLDRVYARVDGETTRVGTLMDYQGNGLDPSAENPGNIELVHRLRSGRLVLKNDNPTGRMHRFQAHGQTFVSNFIEAMEEPAEDAIEKIEQYLQYLDVLYGTSIEVDYDALTFEATSGPDAKKVEFLRTKIMGHFQTEEETAEPAAQNDEELW